MKFQVMSPKLQRHGCYKYSDVCQTCVPLHLIQCSCLMSCGWKLKNSSSLCVCVCVLLHPASQMAPKCQEGNYLVRDVANTCAPRTLFFTKCFSGKKKKSLPFFPPGLLRVNGSEQMAFLLFFADDR